MKVQNQQPHQPVNKSRKSEEFVFNEDVEKHIGKHTGKYFARIRTKTHFDGFPRFSQYLSHSEYDQNSLAKDTEKDSMSEMSNQLSLPSPEKESENIVAEQIRTVQKESLGPTSKQTEYLDPSFGAINISSIKRKSNSLRPSEAKSLQQILMVMDEQREFQFDENLFLPASIHQSESNQTNTNEIQAFKRTENRVSDRQKPQNSLPNENLVKNAQQNRKSLLRKSPQKKNGGELNKQKRKSRVSFKQDVIMDGLDSEIPMQSLKVVDNERDEQEIEGPQMLISQIRMSRNLLKKQQPRDSSENLFPKKVAKIKEQETFVTLEQAEDISEKKFEEHNQLNDHYVEPQEYDNFEFVEKFEDKKQKRNEGKLNKRQMKAKKQSRVTDEFVAVDQPKKDVPEMKLKKKKTMTSKPKQQTKRKIFENQSNKLHNHLDQQISQQRNEQSCHSISSQSQRYPKRTRIRPVSYWQNQKVHYKAGIAIGIERATMNIRDLLQTSQANFEHVFNLSLHSNEVEIEIILPAKKEFCSKGFKSPYQTLFISLSEKSKHIQDLQIHFDDGIRSQSIEQNTVIEVPQGRQFQIKNQSICSVFMQMRLV